MFGAVSAVIGVALFHTALAMTVRANPTTKIPFTRNAANVPGGSVAIRVLGGALLVLGIILLSTSAWYWPFVIVSAGPVAALAVVTFHNRNIAKRPANHNPDCAY